MDITVSVDEEVLQGASKTAEEMGTSVDQMLRKYLERLARRGDPKADAEEFRRLSMMSNGDSGGWKFNREELYATKFFRDE